jgi:hypothetical protein
LGFKRSLITRFLYVPYAIMQSSPELGLIDHFTLWALLVYGFGVRIPSSRNSW